MTKIGIYAIAFTLLWPQVSTAQRSPLRGVEIRVPSIADSGEYLLYSYTAVNWGSSTGGAAYLSIDVSAAVGTGYPILPATGRFYHGAGFPGVRLRDFRDHTPVGPVSPPNWEAFLTKGATLDWYGGRGGASGELDSIAPADSLTGFGLRSPYLPGVRAFSARPTFASCCGRPMPATATRESEYPDPSTFAVTGWTVGPSVRPQDLSIAIVRGDLRQVCGPLHWISDGAVCGRLEAHLAHQELRAFIDELDANHGAQGAVTDNAYWLLRVNAAYLLSRSN